jgi:hypothetical protein
MIETISPVFPRRRLGSNGGGGAVAPSAFSAAPNTMAAVVVFKNSRRDQLDFIEAPQKKFSRKERKGHMKEY